MLLANGAGSTEDEDVHLDNGRIESRTRVRPECDSRDEVQNPLMRRQSINGSTVKGYRYGEGIMVLDVCPRSRLVQSRLT